ncbi:hypothetical protein MKY34_08940 [Sporosarcina sp. FSL K6-1522]|uniref:hypothetical protein n=1 Tax=Sporosarcina sp. FSL K6-1522 TaxID=2921554 RepID=UPI0031599DA7
MKKWLLTIMSVMFLVGCTEDTQDTTENLDMDIADTQESIENANAIEQTLDLEVYEEYQTLSEKIDLTLYQATLETDNPGKRILLFTDADGRKVYKSIFIKHDRHLKIIELDGDGLLYNHQIQ